MFFNHACPKVAATFYSHQVAETSEESVGQHEFPSLLYLLGNGLINVIRAERAESDEKEDASQPHFTTCVLQLLTAACKSQRTVGCACSQLPPARDESLSSELILQETS